ncbi:MAG: hypothetical protein WBM47_17430 [Polyangiales bacterium]
MGGAPACDSTALAFIATIDPANNFNRTNFEPVDTTDLPTTWDRYEVTLGPIVPELVGQTIQVGFSATATNDGPSGVFYDNVVVEPDTQYTADFEDPPYVQADPLTIGSAASPPWGDGWVVFANVFEADGSFAYGYGPEPAPNNSGGFSGIALDQGGAEQGAQVLVIISDYNNRTAQESGQLVEANTFRERTITAEDVDATIVFSFDAKRGNINEGCPAP